jgi:hypothetical protein
LTLGAYFPIVHCKKQRGISFTLNCYWIAMLNNSNINCTVQSILKYKPTTWGQNGISSTFGRSAIGAVHGYVPHQFNFCCKQSCQPLFTATCHTSSISAANSPVNRCSLPCAISVQFLLQTVMSTAVHNTILSHISVPSDLHVYYFVHKYTSKCHTSEPRFSILQVRHYTGTWFMLLILNGVPVWYHTLNIYNVYYF